MAITAPEVLPQSVPDVREQPSASAETFGGGAGLEAVGQQAQKIAADTGEIATFEKIRADQTAVQEASAKLSQVHTNLLYDPQNGLITSRGVNAIQAHDDSWAKYQKEANSIAATLHGDAQKGAFNKQALAMGDSFNHTAMAHVAQQLEKHDDATFKSLVDNQTELAAMAYGDNHQLALSYGIVNDASTARAKRLGLGPEETETLMRDVHTKFHETVLSQMVGDPNFASKAQAYFEANKGQMDTEAQGRVEKWLSEGSTRSQSQKQAQSILASHPESEVDALKTADKLKDPAVQEMTRQLITRKFTQDRQAERNDQDETFLKTGQMIDKKGVTDPVDVRNAIPPADWEKMSAGQRTALLKRGEDTVTSPRKWLDFMDQVKQGAVTGLSRAELEEKFLPYFDAGDKKRAMDMWVTGKKGPGSARLMSDESTAKAIETTMVNSGLVKTDWKKHPTDQKLMYQFDGDVHGDILGFEKAQNRSPKPDEIQQIIDNRTKQYFSDKIVKVPGTIFDKQKSVALLTDKEKGDAYVPYDKIPPKDSATLENLMRQSNRPVTRQKAARAYAAYLMGDRKRLRTIIQE